MKKAINPLKNTLFTTACIYLLLSVVCFDLYAQVDFKEYYESGILKTQGKIDKDSNRVGKWKYYYKTGEIEAEVNYKNDIPVGKSRSFFKNGKIRSQGSFEQGNLSGRCKYFNEDGTLKSIGEYKNDQKTGKWKYYKDGYLHEVGLYQDGLAIDEWKYYDKDGNLIRTTDFGPAPLGSNELGLLSTIKEGVKIQLKFKNEYIDSYLIPDFSLRFNKNTLELLDDFYKVDNDTLILSMSVYLEDSVSNLNPEAVIKEGEYNDILLQVGKVFTQEFEIAPKYKDLKIPFFKIIYENKKWEKKTSHERIKNQ